MGEIKNKSKSCSDGASGRVRPQALGLSLHGSAAITLEIGSRFFVEPSQDSEKLHFVAHAGGFLVGGAQHRPSGFRVRNASGISQGNPPVATGCQPRGFGPAGRG